MKTGDGRHYAGSPRVIKKRFMVHYYNRKEGLTLSVAHDVSDIRQLFPVIEEFRRLNPGWASKARIEVLGIL